MSAYLPFFIPILTFVLGAALTLVLKRQDRNVSAVSTYAKDLSDCATEWYSQLYDIQQACRRGDSDSQIAEKIEFYSRNRLILPKFLRAMEVLKRRPEARRMVLEAEEMLQVLTERNFVPKPTNPNIQIEVRYSSIPLPAGVKPLTRLPDVFARAYAESLLDLVSVLDAHVQIINIEAGKII